jgi:hypothetical protein
LNHQKLLTAQDSSSLSLSMQGRAELEQETREFCFGDSFGWIFFSSLTEVLFSDFFFPFSVQEQRPKAIIFFPL